MNRIILGSQSPRRKEILGYFSLPFEQVSPSFDEDAVPFKGNPTEYVCELSRGKAQSLHHRFPDAIILTADTIVYQDGKLYGKPSNEQEAIRTLSHLAGKWHSVFSGVTLRYRDQEFHRFEETRVLFNTLTVDQMRQYQTKLHCADKAGGYAIQQAGGIIVNRIEGCYYNVMGLPINSVRQLLLHVGIDLWEYLK